MRWGREGHLDSGLRVKMDWLWSAWRTFGLLLLTALCVSPNAFAQTQPTTAPALNGSAVSPLAGRTVEGVRVLGNQTVYTAIILNLVRTREGSKFDPSTVEEDYQRIYSLRKFANVEAKVEPTATGGVIVAFIVTENLQIKSIVFRGNTSVADSELSPIVETSIKVGEANDRFRISLAKQAIEAFYRDRNFPFAHVDVDAQRLVGGDLVFIFTEGPTARIRKVKF